MIIRKYWLLLTVKILMDIFIINLSFIIGYLIKFRMLNVFQVILYYKSLIFISLLWLIIFNLAGLYKMQQDKMGRVDNVFSVSFAVFSAAFFTYIFVVFLYKEASYSKDIVIYASLIALVLVNLTRKTIGYLFKL